MQKTNEKISAMRKATCTACGLPISSENLESLSQGKAQIYCEYCGKKLDISQMNQFSSQKNEENSLLHVPDPIQGKKESPSIFKGNFYKTVRLALHRIAYEMFKDPKLTYETREVDDLELHKEVLNQLTDIYKKRVKKAPFPTCLLTSLYFLYHDNVKTCFHALQTRLQDEKIYRAELEPFFKDIVNFTYRLIAAKLRISHLSGIELDIANDLKEEYGFQYTEENINFHTKTLSNFHAEEIYFTLLHPECTINLEDLQHGTPQYVLEQLENPMYEVARQGKVKEEWKKKLKRSDIVRFKAFYRDLSLKIRTDYLYSLTYTDYLHWLIKTIIKLMTKGMDLSQLISNNGGEKVFNRREKYLITYLCRKDLITEDPRFSNSFKLNLKKFLARMIFIYSLKNKIENDFSTKNLVDDFLSQFLDISSNNGELLKELLEINKGTSLNDYQVYFKSLLTNIFMQLHMKMKLEEITNHVMTILRKKGKNLTDLEKETYNDLQQVQVRISTKKKSQDKLNISNSEPELNYKKEKIEKKTDENNIESFQYKNLTDVGEIDEWERRELYDEVRRLLNLKKIEIKIGEFIPTRKNLIYLNNDLKHLKGDKHLSKIVRRWLNKNTEFKNVTEMKDHYKGKTLNHQIFDFLNSKKEEILNGKFIPTKENIAEADEKFSEYEKGSVISDIVYYWIKYHTPFNNLTEIRESFEHDQKLYKELRKFLKSKKNEIIGGKFIPTQQNILLSEPKFSKIKNNNEFSHRIYRWMRKNTPFDNIGDLEINKTDSGKLKQDLRNLLDSKKNEICEGDFIPTEEKIIDINSEFTKIRENRILYNIIKHWIMSNTKFNSITEIQEEFIEKKPSTKIWEYLDTRKNEVLSGNFIPTRRNLRKVNLESSEYESSAKVIARWLEEKSGGKFKNITELIEHYKPNLIPQDLGSDLKYTFKFYQEKFKVKNAWFQVVRKLDENRLIQADQQKPFKTWNGLFRFLNKNKTWKFVDIITGEIIESNEIIDLHHIDGNKLNDDPYNLAYVLNINHGIITVAQQSYQKLTDFFIDLITSNLHLIKNGLIPESWKLGWRVIARKKGVKLPKNKYKRRKKYKPKFIDIKNYIKNIDEW